MESKPPSTGTSSGNGEEETYPRLIPRPTGYLPMTTGTPPSFPRPSERTVFDGADSMRLETWLMGLDEVRARVAYFIIHEGYTWAALLKIMRHLSEEDARSFAASDWMRDAALRWEKWIKGRNRMNAMRFLSKNAEDSLDVAELILKSEGLLKVGREEEKRPEPERKISRKEAALLNKHMKEFIGDDDDKQDA